MSRPRIFMTSFAVVLLIAACGGGGEGSSTTGPAASVAPNTSASPPAGASGTTGAPGPTGTAPAVTIDKFRFEPESLNVKVGDMVTWTNKESAAHSVVADDKSFTSQDRMKQGDSFSHAFTAPGTFSYFCGIHDYMKATVTVA